jgi:hypothetical protein
MGRGRNPVEKFSLPTLRPVTGAITLHSRDCLTVSASRYLRWAGAACIKPESFNRFYSWTSQLAAAKMETPARNTTAVGMNNKR